MQYGEGAMCKDNVAEQETMSLKRGYCTSTALKP